MSKDDSMLSALLTTSIQVLETLKSFKTDIEAMKYDLDELKTDVQLVKSKDIRPELQQLIQEELSKQDFSSVERKLSALDNDVNLINKSTEVISDSLIQLIDKVPDGEHLKQAIDDGFEQSTKDYTEPIGKLVQAFSITQDNFKTMARHVDDMNKRVESITDSIEDLTNSTTENSSRLTSLDIRMATMLKESLDTDDTLDTALQTLKTFT